MQEKEKPIFIGSGKQATEKYINGGICLDDIPQEDIKPAKSGKRWVNITVAKKNEVDQFGKSHYIAINRWKPEKQEQPDHNIADIPF